VSFAALFAFQRPSVAPYRKSDGTLSVAPADVPRFDHDAGGSPLGLLVEAGAEMGQHDSIALRAPVPIEGAATVFHEVANADGIQRRAHYTLNATATVNACLAQVCHHRAIGAVAGFVAIRSGVVAYQGKRWTPPAIVTLADGKAITLANGFRLLAS